MSTVFQRISEQQDVAFSAGWKAVRTIDMHTGGEPLRVILSGVPLPEGRNVLERRQHMLQHGDYWRRVLMYEPRGHADMYGCLLLPPNDEGADFGILFLHNEGYSTMCGHAVIAITRLAVEMGWVESQEPVTTIKIDAPCGRITAFAAVEGGRVEEVGFQGVPAFVAALDQWVEVPGWGRVKYDLAYGGAFYAYVDARQLDLELTGNHYPRLIQSGMAIKKAVAAADPRINHPFETDLSFLYGTIFIGNPLDPKNDSRNVCIFADGEVDRSPTGSGVSGRMAIHYARGEIGVGEEMAIESIIGSVFRGSVVEEVNYGSFTAVIPQVKGTAFVTGRHEFLIDPSDPLQEGFLLR